MTTVGRSVIERAIRQNNIERIGAADEGFVKSYTDAVCNALNPQPTAAYTLAQKLYDVYDKATPSFSWETLSDQQKEGMLAIAKRVLKMQQDAAARGWELTCPISRGQQGSMCTCDVKVWETISKEFPLE